MKDLLILFAHLLTTIATLMGPAGAKAVVADSLVMKQQPLIVNRVQPFSWRTQRRRTPGKSASHGLCVKIEQSLPGQVN